MALNEVNNSSTMTSSLGDIIVDYATSDMVFNKYEDKKVIGAKIIKELCERLVDLGKNEATNERKLGFRMTDGSKEVGLLPQCQSLRALVSLARDFGLGFEMTINVPDHQGKKKTSMNIRQIMDAVIEDIVERIIIRDEHGEIANFKFDASPYDQAHYSPEYSSIDAITWVVPTFLLILDYHAGIQEICKWENELIATIRRGLQYINEAYITGNDNNEGEGLRIGWNFTKGCEEPSLYFSYIVCECYLDMYNTFKGMLEYLEAERNHKKSGGKIAIDAKLKEKFDDYQDKYFKGIGNNYGLNKQGKQYARYINDKEDGGKYNELVRIYRLINCDDSNNSARDYSQLRIEGTLYGEFEKRVKEVAKKVWEYVHDDLADKFFSNDLHTKLTEADIRVATTSDALFNSVYIINIMIDAGLDEDINFERQMLQLSDDEKDRQRAIEKQREYNNLLESCQLAIQRAMRTYESLKSESKDYIVDQFLIGFNEKFDKHKATVNELRKLRMKVFSLLPMLIHTNNVVSEYLIKYPQHNMKKYLEYILDNRYTVTVKEDAAERREVRWIWEYDGFFSGSNYYYLAALKEFYSYYEKYEMNYLQYGKENLEQKKRYIENYYRDLTIPGGEISDLRDEVESGKKQLQEKTEELAALQADVERRVLESSPMEQAVRKIVAEELATLGVDVFTKAFVQVFENASCALKPAVVDPTEDTDGTSKRLCDAMMSMLMSNLLAGYAKRGLGAEQYTKLEDSASAGFKQMVSAFLSYAKNNVSNDATNPIVQLFEDNKDKK